MDRYSHALVALLCLLVYVQCSPVRDSNTEVCQGVTPQRDVDLQQVFGEWMLAEMQDMTGEDENIDSCHLLRFQATSSNYTFHIADDDDDPMTVNVPDANRTWHWIFIYSGDLLPMFVLKLTTDTLMLASCPPEPTFYLLFSKQLPLSIVQRRTIRDTLPGSGAIRDTNLVRWTNFASCTPAHSNSASMRHALKVFLIFPITFSIYIVQLYYYSHNKQNM